MDNNLWTVICDYDGGTYVSQFFGSEQGSVAARWADMLVLEEPLPDHSANVAENVRSYLADEPYLTALDGLENVWQAMGEVAGEFYTATFVKTAALSSKPGLST